MHGIIFQKVYIFNLCSFIMPEFDDKNCCSHRLENWLNLNITDVSPILSQGPGWLNELGSLITYQLIQAYHQYCVGSHPAL
jgi:hypothetical protein